jgi:hypothetical protein
MADIYRTRGRDIEPNYRAKVQLDVETVGKLIQ